MRVYPSPILCSGAAALAIHFSQTVFQPAIALGVGLEQVVRFLDGERERCPPVESGVPLQIVDHCAQQMSLLSLRSWRVVRHVREVHVQVVEGRLVVEVDAELGGRHAVLGWIRTGIN